MSRRRRVAALVALTACLVPAAARADSVSGAQLRALAARAGDDPGALARLRRVDRVDGRRVNVGAALRGAGGRDLDARLRLLARGSDSASGGGDARAAADAVLAERRFRDSSLPRPFHGLFDRIGRWLRKLDKLFNPLDAAIPGPRGVMWVVLAAIVFGIAALVARRTLTRRVRAVSAALAAALPQTDDPRALERRADAAEAAGELAAALRLRFRAGLLRLDERGAISFRPSISTHEVRRALRSPRRPADLTPDPGDAARRFDSLANTFDDVVYGGRAATSDDVAAARREWPAVVSEAPRREVAA